MNINNKSWEFVSLFLGGIVSFFAVAFLQNFYPSFWGFILLTILLNILCAYFFELIRERVIAAPKDRWRENILVFFVLGAGVVFLFLSLRLLSHYPKLFAGEFFSLAPTLIVAFLGLTMATKAGMVFLFQKQDGSRWRESRFSAWLFQNLPGLLLASTVIIATFALATAFSRPEFILSDNYFDTDPGDWMNRLTADMDQATVMRPVHPLAFLIFRPPVWLLSLVLNGNKFYAALLFNSMLGGVCVFLTWAFFKQRTKNSTYALLMAGLLGLSNSHLILSVFLESYMFSAVALIVFLLLIQQEEKPLAHLVPAGLFSFGITMTNFIQTCILFFITTPRIKTIFKYVLSVLILAVFLAFIQDSLYPSSDPFYRPLSYSQEQDYRFNLFEAQPQSVGGRANALARSMLMFSVVAPQPLILLEETGCSFPCSMVYYFDKDGVYRISSYEGFGKGLVFGWLILLATAGWLFFKNFRVAPKAFALSTALALTMLFNFTLHMNYGDDFMLYSPDWTYALVFFFGISYESFSEKKWAQSMLLIFLLGLMINNLNLFRELLNAVLPFYG
ncbi:MAG TPA: hypothetical protein PLA27_06720 [Anaerolineales bacterium]|jgi:hypothetical protein|nr:hypothetical protein [Anaerolineales bacterium]HQX16098.1 hypothetical protein [Anaerolineales bacterium]